MARGFGARESVVAGEKAMGSNESPMAKVFAEKTAGMKSKPSSSTVRKFLKDNVDNPKFKKEMIKLGEFLSGLKDWQTNSNAVDRGDIIERFKALPDFIRKQMEDETVKLATLWRGDDVIEGRTGSGESDDTIKAFSSSPFAAEFFGSGLYTAEDAEGVEGIINSDKVAAVIGFDFVDKFNDAYGDDMMIESIGDDEGERIVYGIKWKPGVGGEDWAKKTQPARYQKLREIKEKGDKEYFDKQVAKGQLLNPNGTSRWRNKDGTNSGSPVQDGYQLFDPVTKTRIRPPVELELKKRLPHVFGQLTPSEEKTYEELDRRG